MLFKHTNYQTKNKLTTCESASILFWCQTNVKLLFDILSEKYLSTKLQIGSIGTRIAMFIHSGG